MIGGAGPADQPATITLATASTWLTLSESLPSTTLQAPDERYTYTAESGVVVESAWLPRPGTAVRVPVATEVSEASVVPAGYKPTVNASLLPPL